MSDVTEAGNGTPIAVKKESRKLLVVGGIAAGLLLVAGGGGWALVGSGLFSGDEDRALAAVAEPHFLDLPEITVNLNTGSGAPGYLKLQIALELSDASMIAAVEPRMARVLDAFQVYLRELRPSDLEGSSGIYRLKEELQRRVNLAVYPASVDDILFKQILVQ